MKNTSVIISTYTADVSGVSSALYELGGMTVIHDPSGCNSTYNTHDEPRWYDQDSLVFISGLSEMDAIMGSDDKLIEDVIRAAKELKPRFIALVRTPVPMMTGVDFEAIRHIVEMETGIPVFCFPTNGMHSYIQGVNMALAVAAEYMADPLDKEVCPEKNEDSRKPGYEIGENILPSDRKVNLLGVTPLDFSVNETLHSVQKFLKDHGYYLQSCFAMGSKAEDIAGAGEARVNLVLSSAGIEAARVLRKRFGTPYVVGLPTGRFAEKVSEAMEDSIRTGNDHIVYRISEKENKIPGIKDINEIKNTTNINGSVGKKLRFPYSPKQKIYIIGEAVIAQSVREAAYIEYGLELTVLCYLETPESLLDERSLYLSSEDEIRERLKDADLVIADPMYRPLCPKEARFVFFPHEAFSGRIWRKMIPDLTKPEEILYNGWD